MMLGVLYYENSIVTRCRTAQLRYRISRLSIIIRTDWHSGVYISIVRHFHSADLCIISFYLSVYFQKEITLPLLRQHWLAHFYYTKCEHLQICIQIGPEQLTTLPMAPQK